MKQILEKLLENGATIREIHAALREYVKDDSIRCEGCKRKLGEVEDGILVIKCRCGKKNNLIF